MAFPVKDLKMVTELKKRLDQVYRLQLERGALEALLKRETGWGDEELSFELRCMINSRQL